MESLAQLHCAPVSKGQSALAEHEIAAFHSQVRQWDIAEQAGVKRLVSGARRGALNLLVPDDIRCGPFVDRRASNTKSGCTYEFDVVADAAPTGFEKGRATVRYTCPGTARCAHSFRATFVAGPRPSAGEMPEPSDPLPSPPPVSSAPQSAPLPSWRPPVVSPEGVRYHGTVSGSRGTSEPRNGTSCLITVTPTEGRFNCRIRIECGPRILYGAGTSGRNQCTIHPGRGAPSLVVSDTDRTDQNTDPVLELNIPDGPLTLRGTVEGGRYEITIDSLTPDQSAP